MASIEIGPITQKKAYFWEPVLGATLLEMQKVGSKFNQLILYDKFKQPYSWL
jgi:hypothetical protein